MNQIDSHLKSFRSISVVLTMLLIPSLKSIAQQYGELYGAVTSQSSGEALVGVNVVVVGTTLGSVTDLDGKYTVRRIPVGTYEIRVSGVGYAPKVITGVVIASEKSAALNVSLTEEAYNQQEVVITAEEVRSADAAVLSQRRKSTSISDGISAEQIRRTPDVTSSDALRRITGISIVDNKFVFIRGITDRYNATTLDGASVTSTEAGKKSFSFDLLPSNLLDNTSVVKTATPDLPGDFSGGLVQINTLEFPNENLVKLSAASSYNSLTTSRGMFLSQGGQRDWLGFDDGTRRFPGDEPNTNMIARQAPNTWAPRSMNAPLNRSFSIATGDHIDLRNDDPSQGQIGLVGALSYKSAYQKNDETINDLAVSRLNIGTRDDFSVLWGALANLSVKFGGLHKISFKNNFDQSANDNITRFQSQDLATSLDNLYTVVNWTQRSVYTGQLVGEHTIPGLGGLLIKWRGSVSSSHREDPDRKEVTYYRSLGDLTQPYTAAINQRSWARMSERVYNFGTDFVQPVSSGKLKFGTLLESKTTSYAIRYFNAVPDYVGGIPDSLTHLPLETIYSPGNFGLGKFLFVESSKATDSYNGSQKLYAGYLMADFPFEVFTQQFRLAGGARLENAEEIVRVPRTTAPRGPVSTARLKNVDVLPSLNFTYVINNVTNLRLAYSHSVSRPDFRELASTGFYDFIKYELVGGNPDLKRSLIRNYDVRLEVFPEIGEVLAISFFHKRITDAIEEKLVQTANRTRTWFNSERATNTGWEVELRKSLGFLGGYFNNFSATVNYMRVKSEVEVPSTEGNSQSTHVVVSTRPLQGQSPYTINISLLFTEPHLGTSLNILYNRFGRRLETVGFLASDIYEDPRDLVDLSITQPITNALDLKFTVRNLANKARVLTRDQQLYEQTTTGRTYSLQFTLGL
jgi:hypothetical protein